MDPLFVKGMLIVAAEIIGVVLGGTLLTELIVWLSRK